MQAQKRWNAGIARGLTLLLAAVVLAGCGGLAPQGPVLEIVGVEATSQTSIVVTFSRAVAAGATEPANYRVAGPSGTRLEVLAAYLGAGGTSVTLATAPQEPVTYALTVRNIGLADGGAIAGEISPAGGFGGSGEVAPIVASAIALTNTTVMVTFADPANARLSDMGPGALVADHYRMTPADLEVLSVAYADAGRDRGRVILTTSSMGGRPYEVQVTNVLSNTGAKLVDPFLNTATFQGMTRDDTTAPTVQDVFSTSATTIVVRFSEPVSDDAASPTRYVITDPGGAVLPVVAVALNDVKTEATLTTWPMTAGVMYRLEVVGITDRNGNPIVGNTTEFEGTPVDFAFDTQGPRVLSANSTSNTTVVVTFDEPVMGGVGGADDPANYSIVDAATLGGSVAPQAVVLVEGAVLSANRRSVTLTTLAQSEAVYTLRVTDVTDLYGNQVVPPDRDYPYQVTFFGTGPSGTQEDRDGDGLSDAAEQYGWTVVIVDADGTRREVKVTSDPNVADTDGDGISDLDERTYRTHPRSSDTDGDGLSDFRELNFTYSDPTRADTDGDGYVDGLEFDFFGTSPIRADTDGDGLADGYEIESDERDPLVADLPRLAITVGDVQLTLDERYVFTDNEGTSQSVESSTSTTLEQGSERTYATSDTSTFNSSLNFSQEVTVGGEWEFPGFSMSGEVKAGFGQSTSEEYTSNVSEQSATRSNRAYNESVARSQGFQASSEVVRTVEGAAVQVAVDLGSISDVAFSATNLEITALWQDPNDPTRLVPIATLVPSSQLAGDVPTYNLGPFVPGIGPILFENREIFPQTVEQLLRSPRGLVFKVANYDVLDEEGRNFAFSSQETFDATVGIVIDDASGSVVRERVSTMGGRIAPFADTNEDGRIDPRCNPAEDASYDPATATYDSCDNDGDGVVDEGDRILFDADGRTVGILMSDVMARLDVDYETQDVAYDDATGNAGVEVLYRVGSVATDAAAHKAWILYYARSAEGGLDGDDVIGTNFDDLVLRAGDSFTLAYLQDADNDQLSDREEYTHGSSDAFTNSDDGGGSNGLTCPSEGYAFDHFATNPTATLPLPLPSFTCDTISDFDEVKTGWLVRVRGETEYRSYSSPRLPDSDGDGLADHMEELLGTDAYKRDTDEDGLSDFDEVYGFRIRFRGDLGFSDVTAKFCPALRTGGSCSAGTTEVWVTDPLDPDTDGDGIADGFELRQGSNPQLADAASFLDTDRDGLSDEQENAFGSSIYEADIDGDGLPDLLEWMIDSDPQRADSDGDGIRDYEELDIYTFDALPGTPDFDVYRFLRICGSLEFNATQCAYTAPSGADLPYGTNPSEADTDGDGVDDRTELFEPYTVAVDGEASYEVFSDPRRANADGDGWNDGVERSRGTDPTLADTDGDGVADAVEEDICAEGRCMNALVPDQHVTVRVILNIELDGDVGSAGGTGDWFYSFTVSRAPDAAITATQPGNYVGIGNNTQYGALEASFIRRLDQPIRVSGNAGERDGNLNDSNTWITTCTGSIDRTVTGAIATTDSFSSQTYEEYAGL
ncbi:MAG: hypothetical protein P1P87_09995, partial [Trueperaceae bacterium]|nr:hypothetical protein [Trueperaceae bacterium]